MKRSSSTPAMLLPALAIAAAISLSGCLSTHETTAQLGPDLPVPQGWEEGSGERKVENWIREIGGAVLVELVEEAEASNFGLESARQQARAAEAAARLTNSARLPSLGLTARSSRSQSLANFAPPIAVESETHSLSLAAAWEVDLWNRLGDRYRSSSAQYAASLFDFESLRLSLAGQVAKAWLSVTEAQLQQTLAQRSADSFGKNLLTLEQRYERGLVEAFDLRLARAQAASIRAVTIQRRSQLDSSIRSLELLLGRYPGADYRAGSELPALASKPRASLPAEALANRPDLQSQRQRLIAALALERSSMRSWLPSLTLTASDGTLSNDLSDLLDTNFNVWNFAAELSVALFQSGRLKAEREQLSAQQLAQASRFKDTALRAFSEVESALRAEDDLEELVAETRISAEESRLARDQSWSLYGRGLASITAVLDAERRAIDAESQLISTRNQRLQNRINLHLALGGNPESLKPEKSLNDRL